VLQMSTNRILRKVLTEDFLKLKYVYSGFLIRCIVLRYITPVKALFVQTQKLPVLAERLVRLLKDLQLDSHPIFFHVFSNGGSFMYSYILRELKFKNIQLDLRGSIFDSCPAPRNLGKAFQAVASIAMNLGM
jgi:hypothetical protein